MTVYILYSPVCRRHYVGQTKDIRSRITRHNAGKVKSTSNCIPWEVIWSQYVDSRSEALRLERKIKGRGAARFISEFPLGIDPISFRHESRE